MKFHPCVVVPVFNHGENAGALAQRLAPFGLQTFMVNDGSDAASSAALHDLAKRHDWIQILDHAENMGKGAAVLTGLRAAHTQGYSHALQIDADGQHDTGDIPRFLALAEANPAAIIAGCPEFDASAPRGRRFARYITHVWVWIETLSFTIRDSMCGFRVYPLAPVIRLADRVRLGRRMDFDPEILVRLHWDGQRIISQPTKVSYPAGGQSHFRLGHDNLLISWMHTRLFLEMLWRLVRLIRRRTPQMTGSGHTDNTGHWARIGERGVFAGLQIMLWSYRVLGRKVFALLLYPVIGYFFVFGAAARRASHDFLSLVYADPRGRKTLVHRPGWRQSFRHLFNFGDAVLDKLAAWSGEIGEDDVIFENLTIFEKRQKSGRGGVLIASHLGNMEVCRALGELSQGLKLNVLVHTKHAPNFNRLLRSVGPDSGVSLIQTTDVDPATAMMLHDRIARGEFVVIVGDRMPVNPSTRYSWALFFGKPAPFPHGPYILSAILECPVQLIFCLKRADRYHIIFEHFSDRITIPRRKRTEILEDYASRYAARLEHYCATEPLQWFNFFDFWDQAGTIAADQNSKSGLKF
jgi:predicted LPLAT superfamily acyltransferase